MMLGSLCAEIRKFVGAIFFFDAFHTFYTKMKNLQTMSKRDP